MKKMIIKKFIKDNQIEKYEIVNLTTGEIHETSNELAVLELIVDSKETLRITNETWAYDWFTGDYMEI